MKNMILGLAIACLTVACATEKKASVEDTTTPAVETSAECHSGDAECSAEAKAECNAAAKAECDSAAKAECESKKVCPITGNEIN